jgi:hypothetical protein
MASGAIASVVNEGALPTGEMKPVIPDHKLFIIPCHSEAEARFVCGVFNSNISDYLILSYALATGISTHVLERIPIPRFDEKKKTHSEVVKISTACSTAAAQGRVPSALDQKLNRAVARLLGVNDADYGEIVAALAKIRPL